MANIFFDTSGLAKRYIVEIGSAWVKNTCLPASGNVIFIAEITPVEITAAITRRSRGGSLALTLASAALTQFESDLLNDYVVSDITSNIFIEARNLAGKYGLRSLDAIQLAAALRLNREQSAFDLPAITFVSADSELLAAAQTGGLLVKNPNNYP